MKEKLIGLGIVGVSVLVGGCVAKVVMNKMKKDEDIPAINPEELPDIDECEADEIIDDPVDGELEIEEEPTDNLEE